MFPAPQPRPQHITESYFALVITIARIAQYTLAAPVMSPGTEHGRSMTQGGKRRVVKFDHDGGSHRLATSILILDALLDFAFDLPSEVLGDSQANPAVHNTEAIGCTDEHASPVLILELSLHDLDARASKR